MNLPEYITERYPPADQELIAAIVEDLKLRYLEQTVELSRIEYLAAIKSMNDQRKAMQPGTG